jgi:hypothetical protein
VVQNPEHAGYWLQTRIVYCHQTKAGVKPQQVVSAAVGAGIGSGGAPFSDPNLFMGTGLRMRKSKGQRALLASTGCAWSARCFKKN